MDKIFAAGPKMEIFSGPKKDARLAAGCPVEIEKY